MLAGFWLYALICAFPAALYVTQPSRFLGLALVGLFALIVVCWPVGRHADYPDASSRSPKGPGSS